MVDLDSFTREISKYAKMLREAIPKEYVTWMYAELGVFHEHDFYLAMKDIARKKLKITLDNLSGFISSRKWERIENEQKRKNSQELQDIRALKMTGRDQTCERKQQCFDCPVINCRVIGKAALKNILAISLGKKTVEQVNKEMSEAFPGAGFDNF